MKIFNPFTRITTDNGEEEDNINDPFILFLILILLIQSDINILK
ncbi:hypothetical protein JOC47_001101 [Halanaerobacter jeridensis]|uniref:Uncharacterized protein n=1 Tax=Halanaerobacter jeridensis TaxID=706427 RepID=A0A939BME9_9FIRM|nr:hypothetical protein [Halanaerobacter jeridensis]